MLDSLLDRMRSETPQFTVYRRGGETGLKERLADHTLRLDCRTLPSAGPDSFLVIEIDGEFAGALGLDAVEWLLEPPIVRPGEWAGISEGYRAFFEPFDDTVFAAMERRQLLAVSREIEDRAYRVGTGTLRVSFQTLSTFESQLDVYRYLAGDTDLDIHIYGVDDWTPPAIEGISYHEYADEAGRRYWALAFDGGSEKTQVCGLLAQERPEGYCGFWTDDAAIVAEISDGLESA